MEDLAGEKVSEQLKFENLVPGEKKTPEIIPILVDELQPRKLEDVIPDANIPPNTYIIYPTGGYHPFYGVPNTLPRYQLPIWPFIKRIKFSECWTTDETLNNQRSAHYKQKHPDSHIQLNFDIKNRYVWARLHTNIRRQTTQFSKIKKNGKPQKVNTYKVYDAGFHRIVALAWIPNPEKKKYVCHINDDPTNYLIENLKWGTASENNRGVIRRSPDTMEQKYLNLVDKGLIKG